MADWAKIKAEYVATGTSYQKLADKHGVPMRTLCRHAKKENWVELRGARGSEIAKKVAVAVEMAVQRKAASEATDAVDRMFAATDKLMRKAEQLLELEDPLSPRDLRSLSSTLLDVRTLLGIRDDIDREEQQARISKMKAEVAALQEEKSSAENRIEVVWVSNPWDKEDEQDNGNE